MVAGTGLDDRGRCEPVGLQARDRGRVEVVEQHQAVLLTGRPHVDVVALGVHALEPGDGLLELVAAPLPVHHLAAAGVPNADLEVRHAERRHLPLEGFKASITAGFRYSATPCAFSVFWIGAGGASKSQNPLTSTAVPRPVSPANR